MHKLFILFAVFVFLLALPVSGIAQNRVLLKYINLSEMPVSIQVVDEVTGGCFSRPESAKNQLEAEARRNGFKISDDGFALLTLNTIGMRAQTTNGSELGCAVAWEIELTILSSATRNMLGVNFDEAVVSILVYRTGGILTGPGDQRLNIERNITEVMRDLYLEIQRSKDSG